MGKFEPEAAFESLITSLHEKGVFKSYDKPKGRARDTGHEFKTPHRDPKKNVLGTACHIGDEPYNVLTSNDVLLSKDVEPDQRDVSLKAGSIRQAINLYMPQDMFAAYVSHFFEEVKEGKHMQLVKDSLKEIQVQTGNFRGRPSRREIQQMLDDDALHINNLRPELAKSSMTQDLGNYPELCLTLGVFHAAHQSYLDQFAQALERSKDRLSDDELDNATFTLNSDSFNQFRHFLLFATLMPLILLKYDQAVAQKPKEQAAQCPFGHGAKPGQVVSDAEHEEKGIAKHKTDHTLMRQSIAQAWQTFFDKDLMRHEYDIDGKTPASDEEKEISLTCPAKHLMQGSAKTEVLEHLYEDVVQNKQTLTPMLERAQRTVIKSTIGQLGIMQP